MKPGVLGMPLKYFLVLPFVLLLFANYGSGRVIPSADESGTDKELVACQYGSEEVEIVGNADCSKMFCAVWNTAECTYKDGEKKTHSILCPASKKPEGGWTCPGAYDCAGDEDHEAFTTGGGITFNWNCEGAGILNMTSGVLQTFPFLQDTPSTFSLNPNPAILSDPPPNLAPNSPPAD